MANCTSQPAEAGFVIEGTASAASRLTPIFTHWQHIEVRRGVEQVHNGAGSVEPGEAGHASLDSIAPNEKPVLNLDTLADLAVPARDRVDDQRDMSPTNQFRYT